ncbi:MAG: single-stranded DNA-binding protein [Terriglobia bacterium]
MGKTVNKVILLGNVGRDPEIKSTSGGTLVASFSIATSYKAKDRIVAALEALSATQKQLAEAIAIAPPDAIYAKDEKGRRVLVRYIGPTIEELRAARGK